MHAQTSQAIRKPKLQCRLRNNLTDAERKLWRSLRRRQLAGCKLRRQHPFGDSILDFVCIQRKLVMGVDGGQHAESTSDQQRDNSLHAAGFTVLRFWNNEVLGQSEAVLEAIQRALQASTAGPSLSQPST